MEEARQRPEATIHPLPGRPLTRLDLAHNIPSTAHCDYVGGDALHNSGGALLGCVVSPCTFKRLDEIRSPFERRYMLFLRVAITRVNPGNYAYMVADIGCARLTH